MDAKLCHRHYGTTELQNGANAFLGVIENMTSRADRLEGPLGQRWSVNSLKQYWMEMQTSHQMSAWKVMSVKTRKDSVHLS